MNKKLIEVALPLEKINAESAREKSIRHGHPSTLHLWWSRKPLATSRAVIWSSLVDDPSSHPELFPTEEDQKRERERLFKILEDLVVWENSNNEEVLNLAKTEILKYTANNPPALLDPFAGGGSIPLEAQRLGLVAHAHDMNPVAVMINKAMIEIPPRFANMPPVNPDARGLANDNWKGPAGLAEDVRYYGEWMKQEAFKRIGHLYPKVKVPADQGGGEATVIAWIWARTVKCPNPACGHEIPLASSFVLSKKKGKEAWVKLSSSDSICFQVQYGPYDKLAENGTRNGKKAVFGCPFCHNGLVNGEYIDKEAQEGRLSVVPMAIVAEGRNGRTYLSVDGVSIKYADKEIENYYKVHNIEARLPSAECRGTFASNAQGRRYCFFDYKDYFTHRQLIALSTFCDLVSEVQQKVENDAINILLNDHIPYIENGCGAKAYGEALGVYLSFIISKIADRGSTICSWDSSRDGLRNTFGLQGIPMVWNYAEGNPFSSSSGSFDNMLEWIVKCIKQLPANTNSEASQFDAQRDCGQRDVMISTDPPYYDNVGYADLSDYFYVWLRRSIKDTFPEVFHTMLVPKTKEIIADPYRHEGSAEQAKAYFEQEMLSACTKLNEYTCESIPVTIYYAYKQNDAETGVSSGWETMLSSIINSGFTITGTWPIRTEMVNRTGAQGTNALASSIVLVCRKRPADAPMTTRRNLIAELRRELRPALQKLQSSNIAPVDLAQSAIGPGMAVFSKYSKVLEADGTPMTVRSAQYIINQELDVYFNEQVGELDSMSRFCVDLYTQNAFNDIKFGDANILANAKGTSVAAMASHDIVYAKAGNVHLIERTELGKLPVDRNEDCIWMLTQQLTQLMATGGVVACAEAIYEMYGSNAERAKDLAYRLYTIADQKKWTQEAYAYNALVVAWPDIQSRAAAMQREKPEQLDLFSMENE